ncbi:hypothetical protein IFM89_026385 [Coptis chinensis]|uniref:Pentatricopeptide repeat-containing protein n=1 Tax=Coptis chinensis TaxID=261450 RepID=A0A835M1T7_9MAGN|nr:hypothetical protein IFM89_026385 [Coptis chinensis]
MTTEKCLLAFCEPTQQTPPPNLSIPASLDQLFPIIRFDAPFPFYRDIGSGTALRVDDFAIRLDLISKVYGIKEVENYFDSIPEKSRGVKVYRILFNCHVNEKSIEKVELLLHKMRELGLSLGKPDYHALLKLYFQEGQYEKADDLMDEMKEKGIWQDNLIYALCLSACVAALKMNEVSQWMSDRRYIPLAEVDVADKLDLISKVHGIEQAEKCFDTISKKIKKLGLVKTRHRYKLLLNLYWKAGQFEKLDSLMEEMKENGVHADKFSLSIRMFAYAANSDIEGMEKKIQRIEADLNTIMDWNCYATTVNGFIRVGLIDKALEMLKNSEKSIARK